MLAYTAASGQKAEFCLNALSAQKVDERRQIAHLNDELVNIVEHLHFMKSESAFLQREIEILSGGLGNANSQVAGIYESEILSLKTSAEETINIRRGFENEAAAFSVQVNELREKWLQSRNQQRGVPPDVEAEMVQLTNLEAETALNHRKFKYMEEKCRQVDRDNNRIREEINLVKMRRDQELVLRQEYQSHEQDLLNSLRNLMESNKFRLSEEAKFIAHDRTYERQTHFHSEIRREIDEIRRDTEARAAEFQRRLEHTYHERIERIRLESAAPLVVAQRADEMVYIRSEAVEMKRRLAELDAKNATLVQEIEHYKNMSALEHAEYEAVLAEKDEQIAKIRAECVELTVAMEQLCDRSINLQAEIDHYRRLLEGAHLVGDHRTSFSQSSISLPAPAPVYIPRPISPLPPPAPTHAPVYNPPVLSPLPPRSPVPIVPLYQSKPYADSLSSTQIWETNRTSSYNASTTEAGSTTEEGTVVSVHRGTFVDSSANKSQDEEKIQKCTRWFKGRVRITDITPQYIRLENRSTSSRIDVGDYRITHQFNGTESSTTVPYGTILEPKQTLHIYAENSNREHSNLVIPVTTFDTSISARTIVFDARGQERAWFIYTSN
ncbi:unnamed protein product [Caenorhabditis auriculariae]|uniref:LTD domain-containing protein n=1 Tax=Caenorhabditis auriculariae TaxID=2777116 RepID=A0A8S1HE34_9PELO|nr:unnamed protein product [Caenorhabditis auriculariae]